MNPEELHKADDGDKCMKEPAFRVGRLKSANKEPLSVNTNTKLKEAVTIMMMNDFSQIPVIDGNTLKGVISWKTIGNHMARKCDGDEVRFFMEKATEISSDESMFNAINLIIKNDFVLVRDKGKIVGIITTYDLSAGFRDLVEPFLLLAEIENQIRNILSSKLSLADIQAAKDPVDTGREITCISDLSFGEYMRIFQNPDLWDKLGLKIDRKSFTGKLDEIRNIRNDVMHFNPDPLDSEELPTLWNFSVFLDTLTK
jgi:CBS domain-containing protein